MSAKIDITGQRFGRLVAIRPTGKSYSHIIWQCQCDCGNTSFVTGVSLRRKRRPVKSCGCLVKDKVSLSNQRRAKDLVGKRFSRLVVIESAVKHKGRTFWKCRCDCGKTSFASTGNLVQGGTKSCGCLKIAAEFARNTNINPMDVSFEVTNLMKTRRELKKAIKQAS